MKKKLTKRELMWIKALLSGSVQEWIDWVNMNDTINPKVTMDMCKKAILEGSLEYIDEDTNNR